MGFIDDLEESIDIVDLIGRYTRLKKAGANYKALCPFPGHNEKTASFVVSPAKQIWYCFGCHKWWGPVKFIMDMENCEFREAMQILGNITGREIQGFTENKEKIEIKKNLYSLYKDTTSYYKWSLKNNPEVKKYLMERGLHEEDIIKFHFWYADSGVKLYNYLKEKWYTDELIEKSHIFLNIKSRKDKFIGRVIFPIQNLRGDFVAFAGRILGKWEPKYLNSPASDIYDKSSILYGLYDARTSITKADYIIITEWYMDTIALHRFGFFQTVAVSGTALTEKHIAIIKRLTHKIYLCFDNDKAGEQATKNALEILKNKWLEIKIIILSWAKDPDEYLEKGKDFTKLIETAVSPIKYFIEKNKYNLESLDEKKKFLAEIFEVIASYSDAIEQDNYLKEISHISDTPLKIIYELFKKRNKPKRKEKKVWETKQCSGEDILISYIFESTEYIPLIQENIIFPEWIGKNLQKALQDSASFFSKRDLEQREYYKALSFQNIQKSSNPKKQSEIIKKIIYQINRNSYKALSKKYKAQMISWDSHALKKYSELLKLAKENNIK